MSASQGVELFHKVESIKGQPNYIVVFLHLSRLLPLNRQTHYIRIAATTFDPILLKNPTAGVYVLQTKDIVFIGQNIDRHLLQSTLNKVKYLFSEDPLTKLDQEFSSTFNLTTAYQKFYDISKKIYDLEGGAEAAKNKSVTTVSHTHTPKRSLNAKLLGAIEAAVLKADISTLLKNKPVCAIIKGAVPQVIYYEKRVSLKDLFALMAPGVSMGTNPWFTAHMNEIVNERALMIFSQPDRIEREGTFSLNLSLKTILSQIFQDFDRQLDTYPRRNVVIEISALDVVSNIEDFYAAKGILSEKGFQVCLSDIQAPLLPYLDVAKLGVDFIKINWSSTLSGAQEAEFGQALKSCLSHYSAASVIMAQCLDENAIKFGHQAGMYLFQGSFVDTLVSAVARRQAKAAQLNQ